MGGRSGTGIVIAQDSENANDSIIYLAYHKNNGQLRYIASPDDARPSEEVLVLNTQGQQGPIGPQGEPGECYCEITRAEFEALAARVTELEGQAICIDADGDGYGIGPACLGGDCDDSDADVNPAAVEVCDGIDNDCDGLVDESCAPSPAVKVVINEISANILNGCDLIELRVTQGGLMAGFKIKERTTDIFTFGAITVQTDDLIIVHFNSGDTNCNPEACSSESSYVNEYPATTCTCNYDTAWDIYIADSGMTATTNVITVYNSLNEIEDAVLVTYQTSGTAASGSESQAAIVADEGEWTAPDGTIPVGGFVDDNFNANAVYNLTETTMWFSFQRNTNTDNNHMDDWILNYSSWGLINAGQTLYP